MQDHNAHSPRKKLTDILAGRLDSIREQWADTQAAADFAPLPSGTYEAHVERIELHQAKTGTPGVKITFRVADGDHAGRLIFHDLWLTAPAMPQTKRDLLKLGITSPDQLDSIEIPPGRIRCAVRVALRRDDDGTERNKVNRFDLLRMDDPPAADPYAPTDDPSAADNSTVADEDESPEQSATDSPTEAESNPVETSDLFPNTNNKSTSWARR